MQYQIRIVKPSDLPQIWDLFRSGSITQEDLGHKNAQRGFFEYPLRFEDLQQRSQCEPFSLCLERSGRILAYLLAYNQQHAGEVIRMGHPDAVIAGFSQEESPALYVEQLFLAPHMPVPFLGRLIDTFDFTARNEGITKVVTAIPQSPWKNVSATRIAFHRGFRRERIVDSNNVSLGVFTKPFIPLNTNPESS